MAVSNPGPTNFVPNNAIGNITYVSTNKIAKHFQSVVNKYYSPISLMLEYETMLYMFEMRQTYIELLHAITLLFQVQREQWPGHVSIIVYQLYAYQQWKEKITDWLEMIVFSYSQIPLLLHKQREEFIDPWKYIYHLSNVLEDEMDLAEIIDSIGRENGHYIDRHPDLLSYDLFIDNVEYIRQRILHGHQALVLNSSLYKILDVDNGNVVVDLRATASCPFQSFHNTLKSICFHVYQLTSLGTLQTLPSSRNAPKVTKERYLAAVSAFKQHFHYLANTELPHAGEALWLLKRTMRTWRTSHANNQNPDHSDLLSDTMSTTWLIADKSRQKRWLQSKLYRYRAAMISDVINTSIHHRCKYLWNPNAYQQLLQEDARKAAKKSEHMGGSDDDSDADLDECDYHPEDPTNSFQILSEWYELYYELLVKQLEKEYSLAVTQVERTRMLLESSHQHVTAGLKLLEGGGLTCAYRLLIQRHYCSFEYENFINAQCDAIGQLDVGNPEDIQFAIQHIQRCYLLKKHSIVCLTFYLDSLMRLIQKSGVGTNIDIGQPFSDDLVTAAEIVLPHIGLENAVAGAGVSVKSVSLRMLMGTSAIAFYERCVPAKIDVPQSLEKDIFHPPVLHKYLFPIAAITYGTIDGKTYVSALHENITRGRIELCRELVVRISTSEQQVVFGSVIDKIIRFCFLSMFAMNDACNRVESFARDESTSCDDVEKLQKLQEVVILHQTMSKVYLRLAKDLMNNVSVFTHQDTETSSLGKMSVFTKIEDFITGLYRQWKSFPSDDVSGKMLLKLRLLQCAVGILSKEWYFDDFDANNVTQDEKEDENDGEMEVENEDDTNTVNPLLWLSVLRAQMGNIPRQTSDPSSEVWMFMKNVLPLAFQYKPTTAVAVTTESAEAHPVQPQEIVVTLLKLLEKCLEAGLLGIETMDYFKESCYYIDTTRKGFQPYFDIRFVECKQDIVGKTVSLFNENTKLMDIMKNHLKIDDGIMIEDYANLKQYVEGLIANGDAIMEKTVLAIKAGLQRIIYSSKKIVSDIHHRLIEKI